MILVLIKKTLKQLRGTPIRTKFATPYSILFMAKCRVVNLKRIQIKALTLVVVHSDILSIWEYGEEKLKGFINVLNKKQPTIIFTAEWQKKLVIAWLKSLVTISKLI